MFDSSFKKLGIVVVFCCLPSINEPKIDYQSKNAICKQDFLINSQFLEKI